MNRKVLGGVVALIVVLVGVWFLWLRGGDKPEDGKPDDPSRNAKVSLDTKKRAAPDSVRSSAMRWSLDADPEGPLQLEGQVLGPDGKPVGGAEVWLGSVPPRSATSEDDGSFTFDKLVSRTYALTAQSGDHLVGGPVTYKLTPKSDPVVIRLSEGATVTATVVDENKRPITGADVRAYDMAGTSMKTDAKGEAVLRPVRPGYVAVQAVADGYAPNTGYATVGSAGAKATLTLTLHKGYAVSGRVIDEAGKPIAKAKVMTSGAEWSGDWTPEDAGGDDHRGSSDVVTNDKGEFAFRALSSGPHTLIAIDGEHAPGRTPVVVDGRALAGIEITMKTGGTIAGRVVDVDRKPVAFVPVRVAGTGNQMWTLGRRQAISDKDGKFELRGLVRTKLQARAESDQAASKVVEVDLTTQSENKDVELVLDVVGTIAGVVVDDTGAPMPEVLVNAFPDIMGGASTDALALADMSSVTTDGAGAFTIHGLPEGAYKLWPTRGRAGGQEWGQNGTSAKTGDLKVRLTLPASGELVGKLEITAGDTPARPPTLARIHVGYQAPVVIEGGKFSVKDLTPGKYHVVFRGPEFAEFHKADVEVKPGKPTDLGTITVTRGRRLAGKVVGPTGAPVANAKVKLAEMLFSTQTNADQAESWEEIAGVRATVTDASGEFTLIGVPTKGTSVMAEGADGRSLPVPVPEGTDDPPPVTLALRGFGSIRGTVSLKGVPQGGVTVSQSTKGAGAAAMFTTTDDGGNFTMTKVPEGTHVLQAMQTKMMALKSTTVPVTVTAGQETKIAIDIPVGTITLTVAVKGLAGAKVDAAQVFLFAGQVAATNAKQLTDNFMSGGVQGMKIWLGGTFDPPAFDELIAGDYSVCTIPITGNIGDPALQQQLQSNMAVLKVYCRGVKVPAAPNAQKLTHEVPAMDPLPKPSKPDPS
jgi:protocatechuate 3,4-dioxygenase beta subunit